jgi:murein DD-endopeptidase MepM/ murein hydrolase activator NlpD
MSEQPEKTPTHLHWKSVIGGMIFGFAGIVALCFGVGRFVPSDSELLSATPLRLFWFLPEEHARLSAREEALSSRQQAVDALMDEVRQLAYGEGNGRSSGAPSANRAFGLGGGRERSSSLILSGPSPSLSISRDSKNPLDAIWLKLAPKRVVKPDPEAVPIGAPVFAEISSGFGARVSPFSGTMQTHTGLDFQAERLTVVNATGGGTVTEAGYRGSYGNSVVIDHGGGITTLFAHLARIDVKAGTRVCRGQQVGLVGSTGSSTGPHLHYEVRVNGEPRDPQSYLDLAALFEKVL